MIHNFLTLQIIIKITGNLKDNENNHYCIPTTTITQNIYPSWKTQLYTKAQFWPFSNRSTHRKTFDENLMKWKELNLKDKERRRRRTAYESKPLWYTLAVRNWTRGIFYLQVIKYYYLLVLQVNLPFNLRMNMQCKDTCQYIL